MKAKRFYLAVAVILFVGGFWFARETRRAPASQESGLEAVTTEQADSAQPGQALRSPDPNRKLPESQESGMETASKMQDGTPKPGQMPRPPDPIRKFRKLTPEERVKLARQGPIGG